MAQLEIDDLDVILREKRLHWFRHVECPSGAIKTACDIHGGCDLRLLEAEECLSEDTKSHDRSCSEDRRSKTNQTC